jgi:hypothetical protein
MEIKKEDLQELYNTLTNYPSISKEQVKHEMHKVFGEEIFKQKNVIDRVRTFEDACRELGEDNALVLHYRKLIKENEEKDISMTDIVAFLKLRIICAALNEGWEPQFTEDEWRWYPWFFLWTSEELDEKDNEWKQDSHLMSTGDFHTGYAGFASAYSSDAPSGSYATVGSRLCLKNEALADYCGKQFIELWADFNLIRR